MDQVFTGRSLALVAAAGTSRRRYRVADGYSSQKALCAFLFDERLVLTSGQVLNLNVRYVGATDPTYTDGLVPWHELLAVFLRNQLLHEAALQPDVVIGARDGATLSISDSRLEISPFFVLGLIRAVEVARENRAEWPEIDTMSDEQFFAVLFGDTAKDGHCLEYMQSMHGRFRGAT